MENIIVHIFTIGFHHKRGCEIEFMHPDINDENIKLKQLEIWKNLPSLSLPDGIHKRNSDITNFILPGIVNSNHKVLFGVSCFKQISSESVKMKSVEITRNTIQKCVVVLSTLPLFGAIGSLLRGITDNYFEIGDFDNIDLLCESYYQLNQHLQLIREHINLKCGNIVSLVNQELSVTNLLLQYEQDTLVLLKLMLLRRKVVFFMEPMSKLTATILTLVSLFPGVLETSSFQQSLDLLDESDNAVILEKVESIQRDANITISGNTKWFDQREIFPTHNSSHIEYCRNNKSDDSKSPVPVLINKDNNIVQDISTDDWGFPLNLFDQRNIVLPYASIGMLDILDNMNINSFIIGANNLLWKMKSSKYDVIVYEDIRNGGIEFCQTQNQNKQDEYQLGKLLQLTVLDRRFVNHLVNVVKSYYKMMTSQAIVRCGSANSFIGTNLTVEVAEDPIMSNENDIRKFSDPKDLEEWLRLVLLDYIKAILLNAAALGNNMSFDDFGFNYLVAIQQQKYLEHWFYSIDRNTIVSEIKTNHENVLAPESALIVDMSKPTTGDKSESDNVGKQHLMVNFDHPGRFIQPKLGDNIRGLYQLREYSDHSKALMNKSVNDFKRLSSETSGQFKNGLSKISNMTKMRGIKLGSTWWKTDSNSNASN